jgi:hypothetical protein
MAAVMIYQASDPYGRSCYNPLALRAMMIDKLRQRRWVCYLFLSSRSLPGGS